MKKYDVIIIGAGIAGLTFGYLMKNSNKKVLIIDKVKLIKKEKLCGGLLSERSYELLKSIFVIDNNQIEFKNNRKCIIHNEDTTFSLNVNTFSVYRKDLDNYILEKYLGKGGEIIDETEYRNLDLNTNTLEINNVEYKFDYLIGADGVFSELRKKVTGKAQDKNLALEVVYEETLPNLEIFFFNKFKGYSWIIPNNKNTMIGIGETNQNVKIEENLYSFLKKINIDTCKKIKGAFLPTGNDIYLNYKNVFFIGDSAGLISPITGEGIYYSLISAKILSENLNKNYLVKMKKVIRKIKSEQFYKKYVYNDKIRHFLFSNYNNVFIKRILNKFVRKIL